MQQYAVTTENLRCSYKESGSVLKGVDLQAEKGSIVCVTGLSGCGKTTLLNCIAGIIPDIIPGEVSGTIRTDPVGVVFQDPENRMVTTTVEDELAFSLENSCMEPERIRKRVDGLLAYFGFEKLRTRNPMSLSGGQKQLLLVAQAVADGPEVIVLDEPLSHLDADGHSMVLEVLGRLRERGAAILVAEHDFYSCVNADRIVYLKEGRVAREGGYEEMCRFLESEYRVEDWTADPAEGQQCPGQRQGRCISVKNISFRDVLKDFSADFPAGAVTAVTGRNGCGKTTLMKLIAGILKPDRGQVLADGHDLCHDSIAQTARRIGFVMQDPYSQVMGMSVEQEVTMAMEYRGFPRDEILRRAEYYMKYFDIYDKKDQYPGHLSMGEKQRMELAAVLALGADYLLLDEPTASLDLMRRQQLGFMLRSLAAQGRGIVVVSHDVRFCEQFADRVVNMEGSTE